LFFFEKKNQKTFATLGRCFNVRLSWRQPNEQRGDRRVFPPEQRLTPTSSAYKTHPVRQWHNASRALPPAQVNLSLRRTICAKLFFR
jgi:hypothetical protein